MTDCAAVVTELKATANPDNFAGMARFGINPAGTLGVSIPVLRGVARRDGIAARWIAADTLRELTSEPVLARLTARNHQA
ncbi:hypothetical protein Dehly_0460 [Dehalogenimonas lykanthroporepellens BL-DC-9]|nr:hypothetical protein Dehly_0460 [Dehalogenimonas lykanthroporepellens BL-DC-9]